MNGGMHYRFIKRFLASTVVLVFFGVFLLSIWRQEGLEMKPFRPTEDENIRLTVKVRLPSTGENDEIESYTERNKRNDDSELSSSASWIQGVLDRNLTNEEAVEELLKEVGNDLHLDKPAGNDLHHNEPVQDNFTTEEVYSELIDPIPTLSAPLLPTRSTNQTKPYRRKRIKLKRPNAVFAGFLNVHIWRGWCGSTVEDLRRNKHFPLYPDDRTVVADFFQRLREASFGERIFGFVHPPKTGNFTFYISSDDNSELWLSNSSNPDHIRKIAWLGNRTHYMRSSAADFDVAKTQKSEEVHLVKGVMYYIEALHKQRALFNHILVAWKGPSIPKVTLIASAYLSAYFDEDELSSDVNVLAQYIPETKASFPTHRHGTIEVNSLLLKNLSSFGADDERDHFHLTPSIDDAEINGLLAKCEYRPSYVVDFEVNRYEGVYLIHETAVYPDDKTDLTHMIPLSNCESRSKDSHGNRLKLLPDDEDSKMEIEETAEEDNKVEDNTDLKHGSNSHRTFGAITMSSSFNSLIAKLKRKFTDFDSYIKSNARIFGGRGRKIEKLSKLHAGKAHEVLLGQDLAGSSVRANQEHVNREANAVMGNNSLPLSQAKWHEKKGRNTRVRRKAIKYVGVNRKFGLARKHSKRPSPDKNSTNFIEKHVDRSMKRVHISKREKQRLKLNKKSIIESSSNDFEVPSNGGGVAEGKRGSVKRKHDKHGVREGTHFRNKRLLDTIDAGKQHSDTVNNKRDLKSNIGKSPFAANNIRRSEKVALKADRKVGHSTAIGGRKLLSTEEKQVVFAYETDDDGLPSSWKKLKNDRPIFVPIEGVENENKPLKKVMSVNKDDRSQNTEAVGNNVDDHDYPVAFKTKSAYKKLNITSNRDVLNYFRIFRYAFYDMTQEDPRLLSWIYHQHRTECKSDGNLRLNEKVAQGIVFKYMRELKKRHGNKYTLKKIVNVEENHDVIKGDRYLIELDLKVKGQGDRSFRLSKYVYQKVGDTKLCEPIGFQWDLHTTVHVIVPVKNQGRWVQHFIDNMEQIYLETLDPHLNVIIVDFNSTDIDVEQSLRNSKLKRYQLVRLTGPFQRALGIQAGADAVENPHDIIFTCDLHLEIPSALIDSIRKHCIEGKMAFAPIVVRLNCGYLPDNPYGLWELQGYGLFAICKSDFDKAGGMNTKEFKTKWGGEDWEMLDRILSNNLEVERLRVPKFYHYYHTKVGMWLKT